MIVPMSTPTGRDLVGYGGRPPHPRWPGQARIAVNFVIDYEEGSEEGRHRRHQGVGFTRRIDIARHWIATHPAPAH